MKFAERREIIQFRESSPEHPLAWRVIDTVWTRVSLAAWRFLFSRLVTGSERWHVFQDRLSMSPSVAIHAKKRALFYHVTLPKCGSELYVHPHVAIYFPQNVALGNNVYMNRGVFITARADVVIGDSVLIGPYTVINSGNHAYSDPDRAIRLQDHVSAPIVIEDDVWLGAHVTVLPGVTIGRGAVVAAGAIVTRDVEPNSVVAGVPARAIKHRA